MQLKIEPGDHNRLVLEPLDPPVVSRDATAERGPVARALRWPLDNFGYIATVILPTLLAVAYFGFVAADRYEVETKFVVRSKSSGTASQLASMMQGTTIVRSADDAYAVHAYIASRDVVRRLDRKVLLERLDRPEADFWWRYPSPLEAPNDERLYKHMRRIVAVDFEHTTGISTLRVQGFRASDAEATAQELLVASEELINRLSLRAQSDAVASAEAEVARSRTAAQEMQRQITQFRNRHGMIDPGRVSNAALETITRLTLEKAMTSAQIADVEKTSPNSPQAISLKQWLKALEDQIVSQRAQLAGGEATLAPLIAEYERLTLERELAEKTLASSLASLEAARVESQRQGLYLERISSPTAPDLPIYPYRILSILIVLVGAQMLYTIGRHFLTDAIKHAEK